MDFESKYISAFVDVFELTITISTLEYQSIESWDSVGHMALIAQLEELFDIEIDINDIIDFSSYSRGIEILKKHISRVQELDIQQSLLQQNKYPLLFR